MDMVCIEFFLLWTHSVCWDKGVIFIANTEISIPSLSIPLLFNVHSFTLVSSRADIFMFIFLNMRFLVNTCRIIVSCGRQLT